MHETHGIRLRSLDQREREKNKLKSTVASSCAHEKKKPATTTTMEAYMEATAQAKKRKKKNYKTRLQVYDRALCSTHMKREKKISDEKTH